MILKPNIDTFLSTLTTVTAGFQESVIKFLGQQDFPDFPEYSPLQKCHATQGYIQSKNLFQLMALCNRHFYNQQETGL